MPLALVFVFAEPSFGGCAVHTESFCGASGTGPEEGPLLFCVLLALNIAEESLSTVSLGKHLSASDIISIIPLKYRDLKLITTRTFSRVLKFKCYCCLLIDVCIFQYPGREEGSSDAHMSILPAISLLMPGISTRYQYLIEFSMPSAIQA